MSEKVFASIPNGSKHRCRAVLYFLTSLREGKVIKKNKREKYAITGPSSRGGKGIGGGGGGKKKDVRFGGGVLLERWIMGLVRLRKNSEIES